MSMFQCPLCLPFYLAKGCMQCGICQADTLKEAMGASEKIRRIMQIQPALQPLQPPKKLCLCGKGGVGKSTITALFARILAANGYEPLVIDCDDSNPSLFRLLDLQDRPQSLISFLGKFGLEYGIPKDSWLDRKQIRIKDIPREYIVTENHLSFMELGKISDPFQGCACSLSDFSRQLVQSLVPEEKEIVLIDLEAGVESFGRGVEYNIDAVYNVVEPSLDSIQMAYKISYMVKGMGIRQFGVILNRMPDEETAQMVRYQLDSKGIPVLGVLYHDEEVLYSGIVSRPLSKNLFYHCAEEILEKILNPGTFAVHS